MNSEHLQIVKELLHSKISLQNHSYPEYYRIYNNKLKVSYLVKILDNSTQQYNLLLQLQKEYQYLQELSNCEYIVKPIELIIDNNSTYLIMEDPGGLLLNHYIPAKGLQANDAFHIIQQILNALKFFNKAEIIHKLINPYNILIQPSDASIRIFNFQLSAKVNKKKPADNIEKIYPEYIQYFPPEQTGKTNITIDFRSDYYSFGMCILKLLCGHTIFSTPIKDRFDIVTYILSCEINPYFFTNLGIENKYANILNKLLTKDKEDRYPNFVEIEKDLHTAFHKKSRTSVNIEIPNFSPDLSILTEKYYNFGTVSVTYTKAVRTVGKQNIPFLLYVNGSPSYGKSSFIEELRKSSSYIKNELFSMYCYEDRFEYKPFIGISKLLHSLFSTLQHISKSKYNELVENIKNLFHINHLDYSYYEAQLFFPKAKKKNNSYLGKIRDNKSIYIEGYIKILELLGNLEYIVICTLDNIHWGDKETAEIIQNILLKSNSKILFILSFNPDQVTKASDNPFLRLQNLIDRKHFRTIKLKPLNTSNVRELISKIIEIDQDSLSLLSKKIIQLTNGIPLYVLDLIKVLLKKEIIHLPKVTKKTTNADRQKWICDFSKIDSLNNEKDINFLLREKYNNIPNEHKNLLKIASCMDSEINLGIISRVAQKDILDCGVIFEDLMWEDIFIATNDNFEYIDTLKEIIEKEPGAKQYLENYTYQFINKDFKDNIYNNYIHSEDKPQLHFEIANQLNKLSKQNNKFYYYEIAHHYNHSKNTRLNNIKELNKIIQANINAANQSIKLNDFPKALPYLRIAYSLSPKNSFDKNKRKNYNLNKDFARILFYLGHYRETIEIINEIFKLKPPKSYHVEFISILLKCHLCIGETKKAVELLNSICDFQPLIPISELYKKYIPLQYHKKKQIKYNGIKSLNAKLNEGTNRDYCIFVFDNFFPLKKDFDNNIILNYANIILEFSKDHSHDVFFSLAYLGYLLLDKKEQKTNGIQLITEAYKYYQSHNITNLYKPLFFYSNYASFYSNSLIDTNNYISQTIKESVNNNEVLLASLSTANLAWNSFFIVENLTIYEKKLTELIQQLDFKGTKEVLISLKILLSFTAIMKGDNKKFVNYKFNQYTIFTYLFARGLLFFHKGRIRRALRYFQLIRTNYLNIIINDYILYELYFYEALCISKQAKKNKLPLNKQFDELLKILQDIKNVNKDLVEHKVLILQAEELCIQNKFWDAQMLYYQAINKAINHFYRWDHAICNELLTEIIIEGFKEEPFIYNLFLNRTKSLFIKLGISYYDNSNVPIDNITFNQDAENSDSDFNEYFIIFKQLYELFRTGKNENEISLNFLKLMQQVSHAERIVYFQQKSGATNSYIVVNDFNKDLSLSPNSIFTTYPNIPRSLINFTIKNKEILSDEMEFDIHQDSYVYKKSYACIPIVEDEIVTHIFLLENENISKLFISKKLKLLHNMGKVIAIYYAMLKQQKQKVIQEHNLYLVDQVKNIQYSLQNSGPIDGFSLSVFSEAIDKSFSGDFYNISIQNGKNYILLGDVTGHGMPANQVMLLILTNIITLINGNPDSNPSSILKKSNIFLSENLKKVTNMDYTFPVFLMAGTEKKGYSFSGSVGLFLHYKKKENQVEQIHTSDILFGFSAQSNDFIDKKCIVEQGDIILLATDGLIEAELEMTKEYIDIKIDEINEILTKNSNLDVESLNHILIQYFSKFGFIDDVTMILLKKE